MMADWPPLQLGLLLSKEPCNDDAATQQYHCKWLAQEAFLAGLRRAIWVTMGFHGFDGRCVVCSDSLCRPCSRLPLMKMKPSFRAALGCSLCPTFAAVAMFIDNARWDGVPFLLKAGKALHSRRAEIRVQFRHVPGNLYRNKLGVDLDSTTNELVSWGRRQLFRHCMGNCLWSAQMSDPWMGPGSCPATSTTRSWVWIWTPPPTSWWVQKRLGTS